MKKMSFNIIILIGLLSAGNVFCADNKSNIPKLEDAQSDKEYYAIVKKLMDIADNYIKCYHGIPITLAYQINKYAYSGSKGSRSFIYTPSGKDNPEAYRYCKKIEKYINNAKNNIGGKKDYKPSEYLKQDYKNHNEFQQSIGNAMEYRKTLSEEMRAIIPPISRNYGSEPAHKVIFVTGINLYNSRESYDAFCIRVFGPKQQRGIVKDIDYAPDPSKPIPEEIANFNRSLKRSYYEQLMIKDANYRDIMKMPVSRELFIKALPGVARNETNKNSYGRT